MDVVELAARIQQLPDAALDALVTEREVPPQLASTFDLAEFLVTDASLATALRWRSAGELAVLRDGGATPRLEALLLAVDGEALPRVRAMAREALADRDVADGSADDAAATNAASPAAPPAERATTPAPVESETAPQTAIDETVKVTELVHRITESPITLRSRSQLPAAIARELAAAVDGDAAELEERLEPAVLAGLIDRRDGRLLATVDADDWIAAPVPERWLRLATAWLDTTADAAAVAGEPRTAFPLADDEVLAVRARQRRQAERLGLAARGAPTTLAVDAREHPAEARAALAAHVPPATASVYLQPDLSAVAPGPLEGAVEARLRRIARLERAGIASHWRITAASVAAGLADGDTVDEVLALLEEVSLTGLPQPVAYLVRDTGAKFGSLRVRSVDPVAEGGARSQARSDDEHLLRTIAVDRSLVAAGPRQTGPHRVTFRVSAEEALEALQVERYPAVLEDEDGELVPRRRERAPRPVHEPHRLVARLRDSGFEVGEAERAWLERQLQGAIRERVPVRLTVSTATDPVDVELVPLAVANGRLRARDARRDVERTLPLSAITRVAGLGAAG